MDLLRNISPAPYLAPTCYLLCNWQLQHMYKDWLSSREPMGLPHWCIYPRKALHVYDSERQLRYMVSSSLLSIRYNSDHENKFHGISTKMTLYLEMTCSTWNSGLATLDLQSPSSPSTTGFDPRSTSLSLSGRKHLSHRAGDPGSVSLRSSSWSPDVANSRFASLDSINPSGWRPVTFAYRVWQKVGHGRPSISPQSWRPSTCIIQFITTATGHGKPTICINQLNINLKQRGGDPPPAFNNRCMANPRSASISSTTKSIKGLATHSVNGHGNPQYLPLISISTIVLTTLDLHHTDLDHDHYNRAWQTHDLHHSVQQRNQSKGWRPFTCTQQPGTAARDLYFSTQSQPWGW